MLGGPRDATRHLARRRERQRHTRALPGLNRSRSPRCGNAAATSGFIRPGAVATNIGNIKRGERTKRSRRRSGRHGLVQRRREHEARDALRPPRANSLAIKPPYETPAIDRRVDAGAVERKIHLLDVVLERLPGSQGNGLYARRRART